MSKTPMAVGKIDPLSQLVLSERHMYFTQFTFSFYEKKKTKSIFMSIYSNETKKGTNVSVTNPRPIFGEKKNKNESNQK